MMKNEYSSWGNYPKLVPADAVKFNWLDEIKDLEKYPQTLLPYGYGKSYGDSCLNEGGLLLDIQGLRKIIKFDKENGIICCEAGVTLAEVLDLVTPYGWFLAVTPGTKHISVGGAIANDVHGKNHHKAGTFGCTLIKFELIRSDGSKLICSPTENPDLFSATIGGLGLTGIITWAEFRLQKCCEFFDMESIKFDNLTEFFEINKESDQNYDYTVSWVDCNATGSRLGRGILTRANQLDTSKYEMPKLPAQKAATFPLEAPFINSPTVLAFNMLYYNKQLYKKINTVVHYNPFFYPLDAVNNWNRAYGKNGFMQYQFVLPFGNEFEVLSDMLRQIAKSGLSSFLVVLKTFGNIKSPGMLSFPRPGVTMAIDFRYSEKTLKFLNTLDDIVRKSNGVLYPAKDARMRAEDFQAFYPQWKEFEKFIDPKFSSSFWRRVTK